MRTLIKRSLNLVTQILMLPLAITCWLETGLNPKGELVFGFWAHCLALFPGLPGVFLRRGFYSLTLTKCSLNCHIGFGSFFVHRDSVIADNVYIGNYCTLGSAQIGKNALVGSHACLLSGSEQHQRDEQTGQWLPFNHSGMRQITLAENVWIGESAVLMADIGEGSVVGAGSVVGTAVKANVVVAGNPARFVRQLPVPLNGAETPDDDALNHVELAAGAKK